MGSGALGTAGGRHARHERVRRRHDARDVRHGQGVRRGALRARQQRAARRDRGGEARARPHPRPLARGDEAAWAPAPARGGGDAAGQGDAGRGRGLPRVHPHARAAGGRAPQGGRRAGEPGGAGGDRRDRHRARRLTTEPGRRNRSDGRRRGYDRAVAAVSSPDVAPERTARWWSVVPRTTYVAMGAVLLWFAVQLGPFVGEAPDLDGIIALRGSLALFNQGFHGLIAGSDGTGIHPPLADALNFLAFSLLGEDARSQALIAVPLFVGLAGLVERLLAPTLRAGQRVLGAFAVAICPSLAISLFYVSREGLILVILAGALLVALAPGIGRRRPLILGLVLALLPLAKETGIALVLPFAVYAALDGRPGMRAERGLLVLGIPLGTAI